MLNTISGAFSGPLVPLGFSQEPANTVAQKNEPVTLNCGVEGSPPPSKITWEKDGQKIVADSRRRIASNGALIITRVIHKRAKNTTDVGEYQCFASSSMGRIASHKVQLDIAGKKQMKNMFINHFGGFKQIQWRELGCSCLRHGQLSLLNRAVSFLYHR